MLFLGHSYILHDNRAEYAELFTDNDGGKSGRVDDLSITVVSQTKHVVTSRKEKVGLLR